MRLLICCLAVVLIAAKAPPEEINLRRTVTVEVVKKTKDAVVNISATKIVNQRMNPFGMDPFWQQFDIGDVARIPADSLGSGFIVHPDGYVVTNHHVIDRARRVNVELADGRKLPADLISSDPEADLAILKINDSKPFPTIELGDSSDLMIGEPVIAVGNPMGFSHSVSTGIVSAIHRDLKDQREKAILKDVIQTDAAINPGNSGGPLLNAYGQVIGINTAIRGDAQNIGFAIQVNRLRDLIPELMNPTHVNKVDLPIRLYEKRRLTPPAAIACEICVDGKDRVVAAVNGHRPTDIVDAYASLLRVRSDQKQLSIQYADGKTEQVAVRPSPLPSTVVEAKKRLGITLEQVTPMLAEKYQIQSEDGLFISEVQRGSIAANAGLKAGDVIVQVSRYRVSSLNDFGILLDHFPEHGKVRVGVVRNDRIGYAVLEF
jgi:serine protease Do